MPFRPTDEDESLWACITNGMKRLNPDHSPPQSRGNPAKNHKPSEAPSSPYPEDTCLSELPPAEPPQLDGRTQERLRRGKIPVQDRIDLHGLTQMKAREALKNFIMSSYRQERRCVLVITGKGRISAPATLKQNLPEWLNESPLKETVLTYSQAQPKDGGSGAFYLYLRRKR